MKAELEMAHICPKCGEVCHCHNDMGDSVEAAEKCSHWVVCMVDGVPEEYVE